MAARDLASLIDPAHTALVVVDVQNDFCDPVRFPASREMLPRLRRLIDEARQRDVRVIFTKASHSELDDSEVWLSRVENRPTRHTTCRAGTPGEELFPGFEPAPGELVIVKHRYSAFVGTSFELNLRAMGIQTLLMTGIATNVCVESTARDAFQRDFYVVLVADCTSTTSPFLQEATEQNVAQQFGRVASSDEVVRAWSAVPALAG